MNVYCEFNVYDYLSTSHDIRRRWIYWVMYKGSMLCGIHMFETWKTFANIRGMYIDSPKLNKIFTMQQLFQIHCVINSVCSVFDQRPLCKPDKRQCVVNHECPTTSFEKHIHEVCTHILACNIWGRFPRNIFFYSQPYAYARECELLRGDVYMVQVTQVRLFCYLVLQSFDNQNV